MKKSRNYSDAWGLFNDIGTQIQTGGIQTSFMLIGEIMDLTTFNIQWNFLNMGTKLIL